MISAHSKATWTLAMATALTIACLGARPLHGAPQFNPMEAPTKMEWQQFHKMSDSQLRKLWTFKGKNGHHELKNWAWQWRMAWLQRCETKSMPELCPSLLFTGLKDEAMVVRADAATRIGKRYEGQPSDQLSEELTHAYSDTRNSRHGNPLFVCERILEAMQRVGGENLQKIAAKLALQHPETKSFWARRNHLGRDDVILGKKKNGQKY